MNNLVLGEGPSPAIGMIVGEAPGRDEVKSGRPFVGRSGQLLNRALKDLGVDREKIFVTNSIKFMPLDDRDKIRPPTDKEIEDGFDSLFREFFDAGRPPVLMLGRTASKALFYPELKFGDSNGFCFLAWHPSYVLRNGTVKIYGQWIDQIKPWVDAIESI